MINSLLRAGLRPRSHTMCARSPVVEDQRVKPIHGAAGRPSGAGGAVQAGTRGVRVHGTVSETRPHTHWPLMGPEDLETGLSATDYSSSSPNTK